MDYEFRWNTWNVDHISEHGVRTEAAEHVIRHPARGYPRYIGNGKYVAKGQGPEGQFLQAIYVFSPPGVIFVIHARPLNESEKRRLQRKRRS